jgi:hypothetical protein
MWGRREDWLAKAQEPPEPHLEEDADQPPQDRSAIKVVDMDGTAESVAKWINNYTHFSLDISKISKKEVVNLLHREQNASNKAPVAVQQPSTVSADVWDMQLASALFLRDILQHHAFEDEVEKDVGGHKKRHGRRKKHHPAHKSHNTTRRAFMDFVGLLADRFPTSGSEGGACRNSLAELRGQLRDNWAGMTQEATTPESARTNVRLVMIDPDWLESRWRICDRDWSRFKEGWHQC